MSIVVSRHVVVGELEGVQHVRIVIRTLVQDDDCTSAAYHTFHNTVELVNTWRHINIRNKKAELRVEFREMWTNFIKDPITYCVVIHVVENNSVVITLVLSSSRETQSEPGIVQSDLQHVTMFVSEDLQVSPELRWPVAA